MINRRWENNNNKLGHIPKYLVGSAYTTKVLRHTTLNQSLILLGHLSLKEVGLHVHNLINFLGSVANIHWGGGGGGGQCDHLMSTRIFIWWWTRYSWEIYGKGIYSLNLEFANHLVVVVCSIWTNQPIHWFFVGCLNLDYDEPTHILVPYWMPKPLPPRNQCTS